MIEIRDVVKSYGSVQALRGVSLTVPRGTAVGLVGPNGAGKSTLLRIVCGLARPDQGNVRVDGSFGCVPEELPLFELLTGREQLHWTASIAGVSTGAGERIDEMTAALELRDVLDRPIASYSTGMRKKLAFVAALVSDPRVLILDEPFEGIDLLGIYTMKDILAQYVAAGRAVLVSSHILPLLEDVCSRFALIHRGTLALEGDRDELAARARELTRGDARGDLESVFLDVVAPDRRSRRFQTIAGIGERV